jgi:hypothetical protein
MNHFNDLKLLTKKKNKHLRKYFPEVNYMTCNFSYNIHLLSHSFFIKHAKLNCVETTNEFLSQR